MTPMKLKALNDAARQEQPHYVAVAVALDDGKEVCRGTVEYADGEQFGICKEQEETVATARNQMGRRR